MERIKVNTDVLLVGQFKHEVIDLIKQYRRMGYKKYGKLECDMGYKYPYFATVRKREWGAA